MRGTDLTPQQIEAARKFLIGRCKEGTALTNVTDDTAVSFRFGEVVRMIAWYGAMRFEAARDGVGGTLEIPGELDVKP